MYSVCTHRHPSWVMVPLWWIYKRISSTTLHLPFAPSICHLPPATFPCHLPSTIYHLVLMLLRICALLSLRTATHFALPLLLVTIFIVSHLCKTIWLWSFPDLCDLYYILVKNNTHTSASAFLLPHSAIQRNAVQCSAMWNFKHSSAYTQHNKSTLNHNQLHYPFSTSYNKVTRILLGALCVVRLRHTLHINPCLHCCPSVAAHPQMVSVQISIFTFRFTLCARRACCIQRELL